MNLGLPIIMFHIYAPKSCFGPCSLLFSPSLWTQQHIFTRSVQLILGDDRRLELRSERLMCRLAASSQCNAQDPSENWKQIKEGLHPTAAQVSLSSEPQKHRTSST